MSSENPFVLITGGAGFIGSNLVEKCISLNWDVTVVDDFSNGHIEFLPKDFETTEEYCLNLVKSDFACDDILERIKKQEFDVVIHLAACPRVGYSVEHPYETNEINVSKTLKLLEACKGNVSNFVFASSSAVYGPTKKLPSEESDPKDPKSPYALQKSIIEDYLHMYYDLYKFPSTILRFFNVFGKNALGSSPYATAISSWLTAIKERRPMRCDGDGLQTRDMCHVDNVTDAIVAACQTRTFAKSDVVNVGTNTSVSNNQILQMICKRYPDALVKFAPERVGDVKHTRADNSLLKAEFDIYTQVLFEDGFEETCDWFDKNWDMINSLKLKVLIT